MIHAAAPCPVDVKRRMLEWWGPVIYEYYAASEGGGTLVTPEEWLALPGHRRPRLAELRDPHPRRRRQRAARPAQPGTVYMALGAQDFEYHKDEAKTAANRRDGFFTVGDVGYLNEEGYLFLCDRKIDMIISGGANIYPAEIEAVLLTHPQGRRRRRLRHSRRGLGRGGEGGDRARARRRRRARRSPTRSSPSAPRNIAKYKCPRSIDFIAAMPRDPNGKLYKRKLRDPYWQGRERAI